MARKGKSTNASLQREFIDVISPSYATPTLSLVAGKGASLVDADGRKFLDFISGIATNALGAAHPKIIEAVTKQVARISHISNLYSNPQSLHLANRLRGFTGDSGARVFFCNSGAEANEAAIKLSRLTGRKKIVSMTGSFHGRTMGALSITGQEGKRRPFLPLLSDVKFVPYGDLRALKRVVNRRTAMVIVEPIQGENGVVVPPPGFLEGVEEICRKRGALFAIDAVQTGMGRTGSWFGYEAEGVRPDIITLAKGLGGGLPMGAMIALSSAPQFSPGEHGSTFGGNPIVAAAANAVIDTIEDEETMKRVKEFELFFKEHLITITGVKEVRGRGLLLGIVLKAPRAKEVVAALQEQAVLANATGDDVIRIAPPLIISKKDALTFVAKFDKVMAGLQ